MPYINLSRPWHTEPAVALSPGEITAHPDFGETGERPDLDPGPEPDHEPPPLRELPPEAALYHGEVNLRRYSSACPFCGGALYYDDLGILTGAPDCAQRHSE